jgi:hypothetical protein
VLSTIDSHPHPSIKEAGMNLKVVIGRNIALMVVFGAVALTMFAENVRTVQIIGLLGCGAVIGVGFSSIVDAIKANRAKT